MKDAKLCVCVRERGRKGRGRETERERVGAGRDILVVPFHLGPSLFF